MNIKLDYWLGKKTTYKLRESSFNKIVETCTYLQKHKHDSKLLCYHSENPKECSRLRCPIVKKFFNRKTQNEDIRYFMKRNNFAKEIISHNGGIVIPLKKRD